MDRTPKQVIEAILVNLEMSADVLDANAKKTSGVAGALAAGVYTARAGAFRDAISLIRTEAAQILAAPIVRHLSDGTAVEMVRPFGEGAKP